MNIGIYTSDITINKWIMGFIIGISWGYIYYILLLLLYIYIYLFISHYKLTNVDVENPACVD